MIKLYPIIDLKENEHLNLDLIISCLNMNPDYIQIRMKDSSDEDMLKVVKTVIEKRDELEADTKILVNDNVSVAVSADADGVHLGQDDNDAQAVKKKYPKFVVGLSTHDLVQVIQANEMNIDYIGFGPVFQTSTKKTGNRTVFEHVYEAAERSDHPVVFIGGINADNIDMIPKGEKIYVASVSALKELSGVTNAQ